MIDRPRLVRRHNPHVHGFDKYASLSVGNGNFAMTVDATGLQSFPDVYSDGGVPLGTFSNWGWHSFPNPDGYTMDNFSLTPLRTFNGRAVDYPYFPWLQVHDPHTEYLRNNPHRLHLGLLQFEFGSSAVSSLSPEDFKNINQSLDLWTGEIHTEYVALGQSVSVQTVCHPLLDIIAVRVESPLLGSKDMRISLRFPYGSPRGMGVDWSKPEQHQTRGTISSDGRGIKIRRMLDDTEYAVLAEGSSGRFRRQDEHHYQFVANDSSILEFVCQFSSLPVEARLPSFTAVAQLSEEEWRLFWMKGAAVELAQSKDSRAIELERRIILSQYLTKVNSSGELPPQESGLVHNSWAGKFHLEMHWWHSAHFALWGRTQLLEKSLKWYLDILPKARHLAESQGYEGIRWPKCVSREGVNAPCYIEPFLIWQQPHPIYYAELIYRDNPTSETLQRYRELVFETAEFMASFAEWDAANERYVLGPPVAPAQEIYDHTTTMNPTFELAYFAYGLQLAQRWRERLCMARNSAWDCILTHLSSYPIQDGLYVATETNPETFTDEKLAKDHPTMVAALGMLPGNDVDPERMRRTLYKVLDVWNWDHTWGWDYPMLAMTAARLGETDLAIDMLLIDKGKNRYLPNGHNFQHGGLPVYLPGNGGLLTAVAMMAKGWDGSSGDTPGFPSNGTWTVHHEGLSPMP